MFNCDFEIRGQWLVCRQCGRRVRLRDPSIPPAAYRSTCLATSPQHDRGEQAPGLGDWTESLLHSMGVTKERYAAAKAMFGLAPTCGCDERKQWLNRVSAWWRGGVAAKSRPGS